MSRILSLVFVLLVSARITYPSFAQEQEKDNLLPVLTNNAFQVGEKLEYRLHYGFVDAGTATISVQEEIEIHGRKTLHVVGEGKSNRFFSFFFKVRDKYESYIDAKGIFPLKFVRRVNEGGFKLSQDYIFNPDTKTVDNGKGEEFDVPVDVQDMISAFYRARVNDYTNAQPGDIFGMETFIDDEIWPAQMKYLGTETIKVETGTYHCLKFAPVVQKGRIFKDEEDLVVWISNDENKIPIQAQAKILVGSVKMDLVSYEGLKNPIAKLK